MHSGGKSNCLTPKQLQRRILMSRIRKRDQIAQAQLRNANACSAALAKKTRPKTKPDEPKRPGKYCPSFMFRITYKSGKAVDMDIRTYRKLAARLRYTTRRIYMPDFGRRCRMMPLKFTKKVVPQCLPCTQSKKALSPFQTRSQKCHHLMNERRGVSFREFRGMYFMKLMDELSRCINKTGHWSGCASDALNYTIFGYKPDDEKKGRKGLNQNWCWHPVSKLFYRHDGIKPFEMTNKRGEGGLLTWWDDVSKKLMVSKHGSCTNGKGGDHPWMLEDGGLMCMGVTPKHFPVCIHPMFRNTNGKNIIYSLVVDGKGIPKRIGGAKGNGALDAARQMLREPGDKKKAMYESQGEIQMICRGPKRSNWRKGEDEDPVYPLYLVRRRSSKAEHYANFQMCRPDNKHTHSDLTVTIPPKEMARFIANMRKRGIKGWDNIICVQNNPGTYRFTLKPAINNKIRGEIRPWFIGWRWLGVFYENHGLSDKSRNKLESYLDDLLTSYDQQSRGDMWQIISLVGMILVFGLPGLLMRRKAEKQRKEDLERMETQRRQDKREMKRMHRESLSQTEKLSGAQQEMTGHIESPMAEFSTDITNRALAGAYSHFLLPEGSENAATLTEDVEVALENGENIFWLGKPGGGKSTGYKILADRHANGELGEHPRLKGRSFAVIRAGKLLAGAGIIHADDQRVESLVRELYGLPNIPYSEWIRRIQNDPAKLKGYLTKLQNSPLEKNPARQEKISRALAYLDTHDTTAPEVATGDPAGTSADTNLTSNDTGDPAPLANENAPPQDTTADTPVGETAGDDEAARFEQDLKDLFRNYYAEAFKGNPIIDENREPPLLFIEEAEKFVQQRGSLHSGANQGESGPLKMLLTHIEEPFRTWNEMNPGEAKQLQIVFVTANPHGFPEDVLSRNTVIMWNPTNEQDTVRILKDVYVPEYTKPQIEGQASLKVGDDVLKAIYQTTIDSPMEFANPRASIRLLRRAINIYRKLHPDAKEMKPGDFSKMREKILAKERAAMDYVKQGQRSLASMDGSGASHADPAEHAAEIQQRLVLQPEFVNAPAKLLQATQTLTQYALLQGTAGMPLDYDGLVGDYMNEVRTALPDDNFGSTPGAAAAGAAGAASAPKASGGSEDTDAIGQSEKLARAALKQAGLSEEHATALMENAEAMAKLSLGSGGRVTFVGESPSLQAFLLSIPGISQGSPSTSGSSGTQPGTRAGTKPGSRQSLGRGRSSGSGRGQLGPGGGQKGLPGGGKK